MYFQRAAYCGMFLLCAALGQGCGVFGSVEGENTGSSVLPIGQKDETAPLLTITEPKDGTSVRGTIQIRAQASDDESGIVGVSTLPNSMLALTAERNEAGDFVGEINTQEYPNGPLDIELTAENGGGLSSTAKIRITIDNGPPKFTFNVKDRDAFRGNFLIQVSAEDTGGGEIVDFSVTIGGKAATDEDPDPIYFERMVYPFIEQFDEGPLVVKATARDSLGNERTEEKIIHVNNDIFNEQVQITRAPLPAITDSSMLFAGGFDLAGDVNEDGFDDFLVLDSTEAYVRLGGPNVAEMLQTAWRVAPDATRSIAGGCDIDGDGHKDIVTGHPDIQGGSIRVHFGPMTGPNTFANGESSHTVPSGSFGYGQTIRCGNMDGLVGDEIIVGARERALVRVLKWNGNDFDIKTLEGGTFNQHSSSGPWGDKYLKISGPGDINGDGLADFFLTGVVTTAGSTSTTQQYQYVVFGGGGGEYSMSPEIGSANNVVTVGGSIKIFFPRFPHIIKDLDGDGFDEVGMGEMQYCLGPPSYECGPTTSGYTAGPNPSLRIFFGGALFPNDPRNQTLFHPASYSSGKFSRFGEKVVVGDFDGDHFPDPVVASPGMENGFIGGGEVVIYYGPDRSSLVEIYGASGNYLQPGWMGKHMAVSDVNHDGRDDLLMCRWGEQAQSGTAIQPGLIEILYDSL